MAVLVPAWLVLSMFVGFMGVWKGRSFLSWTVYAILLSPFLVGILCLLITSKTRRCKHCGWTMEQTDEVCHHCHKAPQDSGDFLEPIRKLGPRAYWDKS